MQLTDADVARFCAIYAGCNGEELPLQEAHTQAIRLVELYALLSEPTPSERAERLAKVFERGNVEETPRPLAQVERLLASQSP